MTTGERKGKRYKIKKHAQKHDDVRHYVLRCRADILGTMEKHKETVSCILIKRRPFSSKR